MDDREFKMKVIDTIITSIGLLAALTGALVAYKDYSDKSKLQALSELHAAELAVCQEVSDASAQLYTADNQKEFQSRLDKFTALKHGKALDLLNEDVLNDMINVYVISMQIHLSSNGPDFRRGVLERLCNEPFKVVLACRKMLASGYKNEGGIEDIDPNYIMFWAPQNCHHAS